MKVLQIGTFPYPSPQGSQVYVKSILLGLARLGHEVHLLCYGHGVGATEFEESLGIHIHRTPSLFGYSNMRAGPDAVKPWLDAWMVLKLRRIRPDVIHVHNYEAPIVATLGKALSRQLRGVPIVYSAHNTMEEELSTYFTGVRTKKWMTRFGLFLDKTIPRLADQTLVLRPESISRLRQLGCQNVLSIVPGISPDEFLDIETLRQHKPKGMECGQWVVYAGNPDAYQNLEILMKAMDCIPEIGLVMVSASDTQQWQREQGQILRIQTTDFTEVQRVIANADLAVIPRIQCAGFPMKLLNYLALECVTLVSEGSFVALPGAISFPNGDVPSLVQKLTELLSDDDHRLTLGKQARSGILESCTHQIQAESLVDIYSNLLKS